MLALFEKARIVDNPGFDGLALRQALQGVAGGLPTNLSVAPARVDGEVQQSLVQCIDLAGVS
jgi:hypothetical protein